MYVQIINFCKLIIGKQHWSNTIQRQSDTNLRVRMYYATSRLLEGIDSQDLENLAAPTNQSIQWLALEHK